MQEEMKEILKAEKDLNHFLELFKISKFLYMKEYVKQEGIILAIHNLFNPGVPLLDSKQQTEFINIINKGTLENFVNVLKIMLIYEYYKDIIILFQEVNINKILIKSNLEKIPEQKKQLHHNFDMNQQLIKDHIGKLHEKTQFEPIAYSQWKEHFFEKVHTKFKLFIKKLDEIVEQKENQQKTYSKAHPRKFGGH